MKKQYSYTPIPFFDPKTGEIKEIYRPYIPVRIVYRHKMVKIPVRCLLDSGVDRNLFPALWGENIGIPIKKGESFLTQGIGGIGIKVYRHPISILVGTDIKFTTEADFCYDHNIPLLGRFGFFNHFQKITFDEEEKIVELIRS